MASTAGPTQLNHHLRNTLRKIFQHPTNHNIEWHAVVSLLEAVGSVRHREGKVAVTVGAETEFSTYPRTKTSTYGPSSTYAGCWRLAATEWRLRRDQRRRAAQAGRNRGGAAPR